jgi:creatinine amidohydrolase
MKTERVLTMLYLHMRPEEIQDAVRRNVPVLIAAGAVEYHGPHLPIGTDYLIAEAVVKKVEERCECIVMPSLPFSSTMFWAGGPKEGEFDFDPNALQIYAREIFRGIAAIGFKRIYILQHHQGDEGLPVLALKRAAGDVIRETGISWGCKWGWLPGDQLPNPSVFELFRIAHVDTFSEYSSPEAERIPIGHGSKGETQLIMSGYPGTVKMENLDTLLQHEGSLPLWLRDSHLGTKEEGDYWIEFCVQGWVKELSRKTEE